MRRRSRPDRRGGGGEKGRSMRSGRGSTDGGAERGGRVERGGTGWTGDQGEVRVGSRTATGVWGGSGCGRGQKGIDSSSLSVSRPSGGTWGKPGCLPGVEAGEGRGRQECESMGRTESCRPTRGPRAREWDGRGTGYTPEGRQVGRSSGPTSHNREPQEVDPKECRSDEEWWVQSRVLGRGPSPVRPWGPSSCHDGGRGRGVEKGSVTVPTE